MTSLPTRGASTAALALAAFASAFCTPALAQRAVHGGPAVATSRSSPPLLYASNFYPATIEIYAPSELGTPLIGEIGNGISNPYNLCVDRTGTLYVQNNNGTISEYAPRALTPNKILHESVRNGTGVALTVARDGTVYASDPYDSLIFIFAPGSTTPTGTITLNSPLGLAVDRHNTLYVSYTSGGSSHGSVEAFPGGKQPGHIVAGISLQLVGGLALDPAGHLLVGDQGTKEIGIYEVRRHSAKLLRQISTEYPYEFALNDNATKLYVASGNQPNGVSVYGYSSGTLLHSVTAGFSSQDYTEGVAITPPAD